MALTPEDVINKRFQPTKFREGYDQDEVDDFLDEVVAELRRLNQQNEELRQQLEASGTRVAPSGTGDSAAPAAQDAAAAPPAGSSADGATARADTERTATPSPAETVAQPEDTGGADETATSAAGVLAMAQKLHDEYVAQGRAERERLITEGRSHADHLVSEGERTKEETLSALETERTRLEASVAQLRTFEGDYRRNLKDYITGQLREIDSTGSLAPADAPEPAGANTAGRAERAAAPDAE